MTQAALVVGAGSRRGLGGAVAARFAREGLHVFVAGRTREKLEALCAAIAEEGGRATPLVADCTDAGDMADAFGAIEHEVGGAPKAVVYNAGNMATGDIADMTDDFFEAAWRVCAWR